MPARRSEDPSLTDAEKRGEGTREHWDEAARAAARPAPLQRSLPDRDNSADGACGAPTVDPAEPAAACEDDRDAPGASSGQEATDQ
ncbi:hypothetical protein [Brachybacterium paraconglomeratum]|uniref:hypothetical protein n=1 Tax=Brachybacterium paraconglomeratum TaxID=173362 RepID=UPI0022E338AD|nr:hypothetical protein [Brachybacterium paraconglomeratum]